MTRPEPPELPGIAAPDDLPPFAARPMLRLVECALLCAIAVMGIALLAACWPEAQPAACTLEIDRGAM